MNKPFKIFLFSLFIMAIVSACSRGATDPVNNNGGGGVGHDPTIIDTTPPVLEVYTPIENQVFTSGNAINVTGKITDDLGLYQGSIRITNDANGQVLKEQLYEIHFVLAYNFNISYTPTVSTPSNYTVTVSFEDHSFQFATKSVKVRVNP